ncbi:hypothetical protein [Clostridioides difficile]|uniref:hypothetical protein n=1 Tax=Clostridioides difficile TaxID=1496 RepID=UPI0015969075|nr:hypothetical protein [Clostridioides difficile]
MNGYERQAEICRKLKEGEALDKEVDDQEIRISAVLDTRQIDTYSRMIDISTINI